jgi:putative ATP-dependent endonuclease of OLD family
LARITSLKVTGFRSISDTVEVRFPASYPLVLIGENNAGKSNIVTALEWLFGESHPKYHPVEDFDFWGRDHTTGHIRLEAAIQGIDEEDKWGNPHSYKTMCAEYEASSATFYGIEHTGKRNDYISNEARSGLMSIFISGDRRLSYQMGYSSKYTMLSKLMRRFHQTLCCNKAHVTELQAKFSEIVALFRQVEQFAEFENCLKGEFARIVKGMTYSLGIDFSAYDPSNYYQSLRVFPEEDGYTRTFDELGTGEQQLLAMAFAHAYAKSFFQGIILIIEEPEAHLHPLAQRWLATKLSEMCKDGLQIIITTHSPHFVDLLGLDGLVLVRKDTGSTQVFQLTVNALRDYCLKHGANGTKCTEISILPFYRAAATVEILEGFFGKKVVLTEGFTESLALPIYMTRLGLNTLEQGIAFVPVHGKGNLAKWWRFFTAYGIPSYVIFDNDVSKEDRDGARRKDLMYCIGIKSVSEIDKVLNTTEIIVEDRYAVFGNNYEEAMRSAFTSYENMEDAANVLVGAAKPLVARYVAEGLEIPDGSDGRAILSKLRDAIKAL